MADPQRWLPRNLVAAAEREGRTAWLATLPATVAGLAQRWSLTVEAPFQPGGQTAWVAPVRNGAGAELVLLDAAAVGIDMWWKDMNRQLGLPTEI